MLAQLPLHQALGQARGVDRRSRNAREDVRQRPGVVLVAVREDDPPHLVRALREVRDVRDDEVDPEHLRLGEGQPAVDHQDLVIDLDDGDVLPHLADAAERDDAQGVRHGGS